VTELKKRLGYDDSLDVFGVHGTGGTIGALLTGVFATSAVNPIFKDAAGNALPVGLLEGNAGQFLNQLLGVGLTVGIACVASLAILKIVDLFIGLRVSEEQELTGLDIALHGEAGYHLGAESAFGRVVASATSSAAADTGYGTEAALEGAAGD
jgi:Amt family ammonium transporter